MAMGALIVSAAALGAAAILGRHRLGAVAARVRGAERDPTITGYPEPRMPVTPQATVSADVLEPGRAPEEAEGRADAEGRGPAGEARG
jgi:hypothetical protein